MSCLQYARITFGSDQLFVAMRHSTLIFFCHETHCQNIKHKFTGIVITNNGMCQLAFAYRFAISPDSEFPLSALNQCGSNNSATSITAEMIKA